MSIPKSIHEHTLLKAERDRLERAFDGFTLPANEGVVDAIKEAKVRFADTAPASLMACLAAFRHADGPGAVLLSGLPFDATITHGPIEPSVALAPKPNRLSEGLLLGSVAHIGLPFGVSSEGAGVVNNLSPLARDRALLTGLGSRLPLDLHIENAALRRLPGEPCTDGLGLIGVSADPAGAPATRVADGRLALKRIEASDEKVLRDPNLFWISLPKRWKDTGMPKRIRGPIVSGHGAHLKFSFAFYGDMVEPVTAEAAEALDHFHQALEAVADEVFLRPGMLLLINNKTAGHGRGGWEPTYTGHGLPVRFIQRTFWIDDLGRLNGWSGGEGRVYTPPPG